MSTQVLIVGGGIGGLTLAAMCRRIGVSCRVLERSAALEPVGAGISLAPNALRALDQIGLYDYVRQEGQPVRKIRVYRNQTQWSEIDFQWLERTFGYPVYSVERHGFHRRLYDAAGGSETVILGAEVAKVIPPQEEAEGVSVVLKDGRRYTGNVLVGADGVRSVVRRALMATINSPPGQSGAVGEDEDAADVIQFTGRVHLSGYTHPLDHLGPADEGIAHWMLYDRSILTTWPCRDHRQWFVGAVPSKLKDPNRSVWKHADHNTINQVYGSEYHPFAPDFHFRDVVKHAERVVASDVFHQTTFPPMAAGRIAMLGDASHAMTSFFGQGACQAIEDATELASALGMIDVRPTDAETILQGYRHSRERRGRDLVVFSDRFALLHTGRLLGSWGPFVRQMVYTWMPLWGWKWALQWLYGHQPTLVEQRNEAVKKTA
ncbi:hypothetical protein CBS63078_8379 [Aspergillus niger]|uniref:PI31 proteasome regulator N-terminal family protein n=1 Tax=Aspergillus niger TaxID=5061 RepID=A0A254UE68_ASPNG|nr:FAD/NAD(P)-binding domain-containing protein [Aspergillus niger CBS 101883]KAI2827256.1 hypothetical protein CBS133816_6692 [Aspergillus niger]KAI2883645.1 hypothetical protein CBS11852_9055 [Aspergillus niger]KAI2895958.1 hypothetical protein CBS63078_8379 [Aspergillus niger]KAI2965350.1 hypothetical protein CBS147323_5857 [Aspergillus niger]KAI2998098.1 hypothetical protein CBS147345_9337 [Aspergillus niger]